MKKILVASDSFKGSLSSLKVGELIKENISNAVVDILSISDGGEGFSESIEYNSKDCKLLLVTVSDAMGEDKHVNIVVVKDVAYLDVASIVALYDYENISATEKSSAGIGQVIKELEKISWIKKICIGLGGSSTSLVGWDLLTELGVRFLDINDNQIFSWQEFKQVVKIVPTSIEKEIEVFSDVSTKLNEMTMYSAQKWVTNEEKKTIDELITMFIEFDTEETYKLPGTGAAGGIGYALMKFADAKYKVGINKILSLANFENISANYDLVITGEGKFDKQSAEGKVPMAVKEKSKAPKNLLIAGIIEDKSIADKHFDAVYELKQANQSVEEAMASTKENIKDVCLKIEKDWII